MTQHSGLTQQKVDHEAMQNDRPGKKLVRLDTADMRAVLNTANLPRVRRSTVRNYHIDRG